jgi:hypothetical protein
MLGGELEPLCEVGSDETPILEADSHPVGEAGLRPVECLGAELRKAITKVLRSGVEVTNEGGDLFGLDGIGTISAKDLSGPGEDVLVLLESMFGVLVAVEQSADGGVSRADLTRCLPSTKEHDPGLVASSSRRKRALHELRDVVLATTALPGLSRSEHRQIPWGEIQSLEEG